LRRAFHRFCESEIEQLDRALGSDLDVGGLEVAVDDAFFMRGFEAVGHLAGDVERSFQGHRSLEGFAFDQLHDQRALLDAIDCRDVWMVKRRQRAGFALQAGQAFGVPSQRGRQHFDGYVALQFVVAGAIDFAHASLADGGEDFVGAELFASRERHID
jgi:hypothetical protein